MDDEFRNRQFSDQNAGSGVPGSDFATQPNTQYNSQYGQAGFSQAPQMTQTQGPVIQEPNNPNIVQQPPQANKPAGFFKRHKVPIIIGAAVIVVAVVAAIILIPKGSSGGNGYVAQAGEELKINEKADKFGVTLLSDLEKISKDGDNFLRLKVSIKNYDSDSLHLALSPFELVDSSYNTVYEPLSSVTSMLIGLEQYISEVGSGKTEEGYLYFYSKDENDKYETDYAKIGDVKYLKAQAICGAKDLGGGTYDVSYADYYLPIK